MSAALVLDSEGLAKAVQRDREVHEWLAAVPATPTCRPARRHLCRGARRGDPPQDQRRRTEVDTAPAAGRAGHPAIAQSASTLLRTAGLHGHKYAIDAMLCASTLAHPGRITILTPDVEDIAMLTNDHARIATEKV